MPFFCQDADLLAWEPSLFVEEVFAHQALLANVAGTIAGTDLTLSAGSFADSGVFAGMVAQLTNADASLTQLVEIVAVTNATTAVISALRARVEDAAVRPLLQGAVTVRVVSFRPQIAAIGDGLLAAVGIASDRDSAPAPVYADLGGFGPACVFGTLAALFRTAAAAENGATLRHSKRDFYAGLAAASRLTLSATVDRDGDGIPETRIHSAQRTLVRV